MIRKRFSWDPDGGTAACELVYKGRFFKGEAHCHWDDYDFQSERTGCFIAEMSCRTCDVEVQKKLRTKTRIASTKTYIWSLGSKFKI